MLRFCRVQLSLLINGRLQLRKNKLGCLKGKKDILHRTSQVTRRCKNIDSSYSCREWNKLCVWKCCSFVFLQGTLASKPYSSGLSSGHLYPSLPYPSLLSSSPVFFYSLIQVNPFLHQNAAATATAVPRNGVTRVNPMSHPLKKSIYKKINAGLLPEQLWIELETQWKNLLFFSPWLL